MKKSIIFLFIIASCLFVNFVIKTPEYFAYDFCKIVKSENYNEVFSKVNSEKILENKLSKFGINLKSDTKNEGFLANVTNYFTDTLKNKASDEIKKIIKKEILLGHNLLKDVSSFDILKLLLTKKLNENTLKKEVINDKKVKFIFNFGSDKKKSYILEKNQDNKWEVVEFPYDPTKDVVEKINAKNINKIIETSKHIKSILVEKD